MKTAGALFISVAIFLLLVSSSSAGASPSQKDPLPPVATAALPAEKPALPASDAPGDCIPGAGMVPSPNAPGYNDFNAVYSLPNGEVWTLGKYFKSSRASFYPMVHRLSGSTWTEVNLPPTGDTDQINALAVLSSTDVWAVGNTMTRTLILHWDGAAWANVPAPNPFSGYGNVQLLRAAGVSTNDVWAVGWYMDPSSPWQLEQSLTMHWDGTAWSIVPTPGGSTANRLLAVTTLAPDNVWAAGTADTPWVLHWDGTAWTQVPTDPTPGSSPALTAVSASGPDDVWFAGAWQYYNYPRPLVMHWDGTSISVETTPQPDPDEQVLLTSIVALQPGDVWAAGILAHQNPIISGDSYQYLLHYDGSQWNIVPGSGTERGKLYDMTALPGGQGVAAVGLDSVPPQTLFQRWNGSQWAREASPNPGTASNILFGVDVVSTNDAWAVGTYETAVRSGSTQRGNRSLAIHWDGSAWTVTGVPGSLDVYPSGVLYGVDAITTNNVWAVGVTGDYQGDYVTPMAAHWNGVAWTTVDVERPTGETSHLYALAAAAPNDIWAVGSYEIERGATGPRLLIEHWNGSTWNIAPAPDTGGVSANLQDISMLSPTDIWAVGSIGDWPNSRPLAIHWNGTAWSIVPVPAVDSQSAYLLGVAAVSSTEVWAVGGALLPDSTSRNLILRWDGTSWTEVPAPSVSGFVNALSAVAWAGGRVWAAGYVRNGGGSIAAVLGWDGLGWRYLATAQPGQLTTSINAIAAGSASDAWLVGEFSAGVPFRSFIQHIGLFSDVVPTDYFYTPVDYLVAHGAISGYGDCTFHPWSNTTRAQLTKIVTLAEGWAPLNPAQATFEDVPPGSTFYGYVEAAASRGVISGYPCGGPGDPCLPPGNRPYFHPSADVTRGQVAKIVVMAEGWSQVTPVSPSFTDVPPGSTFYGYVEAAVSRGVLTGYPCGLSGEPCDPENRPYFHPDASSTRGQLAKIVYRAVTAP